MPNLVHAASDLQLLVYLIVIVFWALSWLGQRARDKRGKPPPQDRPTRPAPDSEPEPVPGNPFEAQMRELFEQMTGQNLPRPPRPERKPGPAHLRRRPPAPAMPPPIRQPQHSATPHAIEAYLHESPAVVAMPAAVFRPMPVNVALPRLSLPSTRPLGPQRSPSHRLAWLRGKPGALREIMLARVVLDPPKALE